MDLREIASAYQSIYLKEEVEDNILLEDLSQNEVDDLVEEIIDEFLEEGFSLEQIEEGFEDYISEESEVLNEARRAKKARQGAKSYEQVKAEIDAKEAAKKAARAAKVVRPSEKIAASAKKAVAKRKDATGTTSGAGAQGTVRSKGGSMGAEGKKGTALPPAKIKGALPATRTVTKGEQQAAAKAKETIKKGVGYALKKRDMKRGNRRDYVYKVDISKKDDKGKVIPSSKEPKSVKDKVLDAASSVRVDVTNAAKGLKRKAGKALGKLASKLSEEGGQLDPFDTVIAYLIDEGIASDFTEAVQKMTKLSEETVSKIHAAQLQLLDEAYTVTNADKKGNTQAYKNYKAGMKGKDGKPLYKAADHMKEND